MKRINIIWSIAKAEYLRWLTQPRMLMVGVLIIVIYNLAVGPLMERAEKMQSDMSVFEPFVAVGNSPMLVLLIPIVFLVLCADYPKIDATNLFYIFRTGKRYWILGQLVFMLMAIITYVGTIIFFSILSCTNGRFSFEWSYYVVKYNLRFPDEYGSFDSYLIPSNLYNQISLGKAFVMTTIYLVLYLFLLTLLLYFFRMFHHKTLGLLAVILVISFGMITYTLNTDIKWIFPMSHTLTWLHYEEILSKPIIPIWITTLYWIGTIAFGIILNLLKSRHFEIQQMEG